jgi:FtsP/CotA-like multicopper oxidase with cupredoxin domain
MKSILSIAATFTVLIAFGQNPLFIPEIISGEEINLTLQAGEVQFFNGTPTQTMGANGNLLGPTIVLNRYENVTINVNNQLGEETTLHWHGLNVAPTNDGGPHVVIEENTVWSPAFPVLDWAGTYWYHPHLHMKTNEHVSKGIAGLIIVNDEFESALELPRTYGTDDIPLIIQSKSFDSNNQITWDNASDNVIMVNGTINPFAEIPAQIVRLRLLNGASERVLELGFNNNMSFSMIASDGGLRTAPLPLTRLRLAPGERAEILINLNSMEGQNIQLLNYGAELPNAIYGAAQPGMGAGQTIPGYAQNPLNGNNYTIINFNIVEPTLEPVTTIPATLVSHNPWPEASANQTRLFTFMPEVMGPNALQGEFMINNQMFDMDVINEYVPFGNTEIWQLTNQSPIAHPFHIHKVHFYILDINGVAPPAYLAGRKDVILVPAGNSVVRFITQFDTYHDNEVPYMYHCHMLTHEDHGMMGQFIVNSPTVAVNEQVANENGYSLFPNPANSELNISSLKSDVQKYVLMDKTGRILEHGQFAGQKVLSLDHLAAGVYFIQLGANAEHSFKFVKE